MLCRVLNVSVPVYLANKNKKKNISKKALLQNRQRCVLQTGWVLNITNPLTQNSATLVVSRSSFYFTVLSNHRSLVQPLSYFAFCSHRRTPLLVTSHTLPTTARSLTRSFSLAPFSAEHLNAILIEL